MKCSSRRNCNKEGGVTGVSPSPRLNEVQLPKELQPSLCGSTNQTDGLNEVQLPKELQRERPAPPLTSREMPQ